MLTRDAGRCCSCAVDGNSPDLQKSSERTDTKNAEEKKYLLGDETASEKNRHAHALMSDSQRNSEASGEETLKIELFLKFSGTPLRTRSPKDVRRRPLTIANGSWWLAVSWDHGWYTLQQGRQLLLLLLPLFYRWRNWGPAGGAQWYGSELYDSIARVGFHLIWQFITVQGFPGTTRSMADSSREIDCWWWV